MNSNKSSLIKITLLITACLGTFSLAQAQASLSQLQVEYQVEPLGIEVEKPLFSWQMTTNSEERGQSQNAYQIVIKDEEGKIVWNTQKITANTSIAISYDGEKLQPTTRYRWNVTVWNQDNKEFEASSWFETGLMNSNPDLTAWDGAKWIGGSRDDMVFYSHYLAVFKIDYQLQLDKKSKSTKAGFVFGANDSRLMDKNKNLQGVENKKNESYISFELDISAVDGTKEGFAKFNVYRVGYDVNDNADAPFKSFDIPLTLVNVLNKYDTHQLNIVSIFGIFDIYLNGISEENKISHADSAALNPFASNGMNLNPVGKGHDFICFPVVGDIGFSMAKNQKAFFSNIEIKNYRAPSKALFKENLVDHDGVFSSTINKEGNHLSVKENAFVLNGNNTGTLIIENPSKNAAPMLRTAFTTKNKTIKKARLYTTSRGIYEAYVNGERLGQDYFNPGLTQYNKTHMYQTHDITKAISQDANNAIGVWLGEGWWSGNITYTGNHWNYFGDRQSMLDKIVIQYDDGEEQIITSNPQNWKLFTDGPLLYGSFFQGEVYDATKEEGIKGWSTSDYDDSQWKAVVEVPLEGTSFLDSVTGATGITTSFHYDDLAITGQIGKNAQIVKTLTAQSLTEVRPGVFVYDMGQNMVGFPNISISNGKKGAPITLRYAEVKYPDLSDYEGNTDMIMLENIRAALTQDIYIQKGGKETIQPRFTFHGYRYIEITGIEEALPLDAVKGKVISSVHELASKYETSNPLVNKLWENITWSTRGNFLSIPTDTPARNERMGWSGDISVFSKTATFITNANPFLKRHLLAIRDIQAENGRFTDVAPVGGGFGGTLWGSAGIVVAWETYRQYGDISLLQEHYDAMKKYVEFLDSKINEDNILEEGPLGDWLSPEGETNDNTMLWTAYHVYDLDIMIKVANILGKNEDALTFEKRYAERKAFFNATYVDPSTHKTVHTGHPGFRFGPPLPEDKRKKAGDFIDNQASYAIPLSLNVFSEEHNEHAAQHLANAIARKNTDDGGTERPEYSLMTGFIGTASVSDALSKNNYHAHAYRLLQQEQYPSWLYPVVNGATTIWERLNSYTVEEGFGGNNSMNSFNHYSFGAVASWMYNYSLGIQRDPSSPAFKKFVLKPTPDPDGVMTWAKGHYDSMYGTIRSEWKIEEDGVSYQITVPENTSATLYLKAASAKKILENGKKITKTKDIHLLTTENGYIRMEIPSGDYHFKVIQ
ncbi:MAG: alpha-L-rhamnosidase [Flavobacteriaceae bacterium]|nr:MAG: alpha-L-rhamnosidase [Flavobacteriaceae bacterium]